MSDEELGFQAGHHRTRPRARLAACAPGRALRTEAGLADDRPEEYHDGDHSLARLARGTALSAWLRAVVVDDEPHAVRRLVRLLKETGRVQVVGTASHPNMALTFPGWAEVDVAFLDIVMPGMTGVELARHLPGDLLVVFITSHNEYAVQAFEVHAVDYLLKPFTPERLHEAVEHVRLRLADGRREAAADPRLVALLEEVRQRGRYLQRVPVRAGARIVLLDTSEVDWIQAADNYVLFHSAGREYLLRETLVQLEQELDPRQFVRIHRSALVRLDRIGDMLPSVHGDFRVTLKTGAQLTLSRHYRERVERVLRRPL